MDINLDWRRESSAVWPGVSFEIRPLKVWAFHQLLDYWDQRGSGGAESPPAEVISASDGVKLIDVAARIFPDHIRALDGLQVSSEGQQGGATVEMLCEETQFLPLAGEIISRLVVISEIAKEDGKN